MQLSLTTVILALTAAAAAAPGKAQLRRRYEEATCGDAFYSASQIAAAADAACEHFQDGTQAGSSSYPHTYNNWEEFDFKGFPGPFQEFPVVSGGAYTGGSPGPDRVVITEDCELAGTITHTGADGNAFVACDGTSKYT